MSLYHRMHRTFIHHAEDYYPLLQDQGLLDGISSLLSIGAGEGELEIKIAKEHGVFLGYVDPSDRRAKEFSLQAQEHGVESLTKETHVGTFQTFESHHQFDLVISVHSWYSIGFNRPILQKALDFLSPGGRLFITISSEEDVVKGNLSKREPQEIAENLSEWASSEGFKHDFFVHRVPLPVEDFFHDGCLSEEAKALIAFINRAKWDDLPNSLKDGARDLFLRHRPQGSVEKSQGCLVFASQAD